jgi:ubiquitin carboxyl-terminal hydrolase 4/11/15
MNVDPKKSVIAEMYKSKFYKIFDESRTISDQNIQQGDDVGVFELEVVPTNCPPPKKKSQKIRSMLNTYPNSDEEEDVPEGDSPLAQRCSCPSSTALQEAGHRGFSNVPCSGYPRT